jgi:hypothetical protein
MSNVFWEANVNGSGGGGTQDKGWEFDPSVDSFVLEFKMRLEEGDYVEIETTGGQILTVPSMIVCRISDEMPP